MTLQPRVVVTGSRDWGDGAAVYAWLSLARSFFQGAPLLVAHGACSRGADALVEAAVADMNIRRRNDVVRTVRFPVDPDLDGSWPAAGPRRNERMLDTFKPSLVLAFILPDLRFFVRSKGTRGCVRAAEKRGILVWPVLGS